MQSPARGLLHPQSHNNQTKWFVDIQQELITQFLQLQLNRKSQHNSNLQPW